MTSKEVLRTIEQHGGRVARQSGSHAIARTPGGCQTVVPIHKGDIPKGTLAAIRRQLAPCLGEDWLPR